MFRPSHTAFNHPEWRLQIVKLLPFMCVSFSIFFPRFKFLTLQFIQKQPESVCIALTEWETIFHTNVAEQVELQGTACIVILGFL
jgi:hypothetical protein